MNVDEEDLGCYLMQNIWSRKLALLSTRKSSKPVELWYFTKTLTEEHEVDYLCADMG